MILHSPVQYISWMLWISPLIIGYIEGLITLMTISLTENDSGMHFLIKCSDTSMKVKGQKLCNLIKYAFRLICML